MTLIKKYLPNFRPLPIQDLNISKHVAFFKPLVLYEFSILYNTLFNSQYMFNLHLIRGERALILVLSDC